ncbi:EF-hand domain-containing protein [Celeribacter sp.]|uniref:EF-hand domain-containing protein n=1 Tax=Celeribacter sp. TaxID=1890673 RepID=UPI003A95791E
MKRKAMISAVALVAILGGSLSAYAAGNGHDHGDRMQRGGAFGPKLDFAAVDTDGDGKVTDAELEAFRAAKFAEIDTNSDGSIDADEMAAHHEKMREERQLKGVQKMIDRRDTNDDGVLSAEEFAPAPKVSLFERIDTDGDGAISQEELEAAMEKFQERGGKRGPGGKGGMKGQKQ